MRVDAFDFELPEDRIALRPMAPREQARLLDVRADGRLSDRRVADLPELLRPGDVLVVNDTRVIPARLVGRVGAARVELNLHKRRPGAAEVWAAFARPARKLSPGSAIELAPGVALSVVAKGEGGEVDVVFPVTGSDFLQLLDRHGDMPLPPYIARRRAPDVQDAADYQTVYAERQGAVAAPTAGLHLTPQLIETLTEAGIQRETVTLHVGAGTFLPVKAEDTEAHVMHAEWIDVSAETAARLNAARTAGGRIVAVGTTVLRALESTVDEDGKIRPFTGETDIFITPGDPIRSIDLLMTNFHLPKSTLFMLVSAISGLKTMQAAYAHAIDTGYRFYSYGDACLLHVAADAD